MAHTAIAITQYAANAAVNPIAFAAVDAVNGNEFENDGKTIIIVRNASASPVTVTFTSVADEAGRTGDVAAVVAAGDTMLFGPLRPSWWNQRSGDHPGSVLVTFSASTSITVAAVRLNA